MSFRLKLKLAVLSRLISMTVITVFALAVMIAVNLKGRKIEQEEPGSDLDRRPALVSVTCLEPAAIEITKKYSGMMRPFERYALGFKSAGRVATLGQNEQGKELDEGDVVTAGTILARLDIRILQAQFNELKVTRDFAKLEYEKGVELRQTQGAISDTEFQRRKSEWEIAQARLDTLQTQIDDGVLRSPVDGVIARRLVNAGESVNLGQTVFELIQVDQLKLMVGVPESKIGRMIAKFNRREPLKVYVDLVGRENMKTQITPLSGTVELISETSDDRSGLFEVEVLLDNRSGMLRPGMIGIARIVVDQFEGYRVPVDAVFFRDGEISVFVVAEAEWPPGTDPDAELESSPDSGVGLVARRYVIPDRDCELEGDFLAIRELPLEARQVIVGGHRRLVDGRRIQVVDPN